MEYGNGTNQIVFIKDFASEDEADNGKLFSDWMGGLYKRHFQKHYNIKIEDAYAYTLLDKRPRGGAWSAQKFDSETEEYYTELTKLIKPKMIFAFGEGAYKFCFPDLPEKSTDFKLHGRAIYSNKFDCFVGCLIRDAKSKDFKTQSLVDVDNIFKNKAQKEKIINDFDFDSGNYVIETADYFEHFVDGLINEGKEIAFDYETFGTNPWSKNAKLYSVAITNSVKKSWIVFIECKNKHSEADVKRIKKALVKLLTSDVPKIAQNLEFEWIWSKVYLGCDINNYIYDTMIGKHVLDDATGITSLEFQTFELFGTHHKNVINFKKFESEDDNKIIRYNNLDSRITLLLKQLHQQEFREDPELQRGMDFFNSCLPALYDMKYQGVAIDVDELSRQLTISMDYVDKFQARLEQLKVYKDFAHKYEHPINFNSSKDMKNLLYSDLKIKPFNFTPAGKRKILDCEKQIEKAKNANNLDEVKTLKAELKQIKQNNGSTDADTLEAVSEMNDLREDAKEFFDLVMSHRKHGKIISTYLGPYLNYIEESNVLHPTCAIHTTRTYRSSYLNPNLQNIPKRYEVAKEIRKVFIPKLDFFLDGDFSGAEVRTLAMLSRDPTLVKELKNNVDIHGYWAAKLFDKKECDITTQERADTKQNFVFLFFYGGWNSSSAKALGLPLKHIKRLETELWNKYPGIKRWQNAQQKFYNANRYVQNPFGFRRRGPLKPREIINTPIQGTSFLLLLTGIRDTYLELVKRGLISHAVLQIHDELLIDTKESELEQVIEIADTNMCKQHYEWQILPMYIDWKVGNSFGELKKI